MTLCFRGARSLYSKSAKRNELIINPLPGKSWLNFFSPSPSSRSALLALHVCHISLPAGGLSISLSSISLARLPLFRIEFVPRLAREGILWENVNH